MTLFRDRVDAGKKLAAALRPMKGQDIVVLGIPRGGVVVANEVARELGAPLDIVVAKKIGAPGEPEYALGAITQEGDAIVDRKAAESVGATEEYIRSEVAAKTMEVRERVGRFRGKAPHPSLVGKVVIIVDDGIATGNSMGAAVISVKRRGPKEVVVAVPVAPPEALRSLPEGLKVVCLQTPEPFFAIGRFYGSFDQVEDAEVREILESNRRRTPRA